MCLALFCPVCCASVVEARVRCASPPSPHTPAHSCLLVMCCGALVCTFVCVRIFDATRPPQLLSCVSVCVCVCVCVFVVCSCSLSLSARGLPTHLTHQGGKSETLVQWHRGTGQACLRRVPRICVHVSRSCVLLLKYRPAWAILDSTHQPTGNQRDTENRKSEVCACRRRVAEDKNSIAHMTREQTTASPHAQHTEHTAPRNLHTFPPCSGCDGRGARLVAR